MLLAGRKMKRKEQEINNCLHIISYLLSEVEVGKGHLFIGQVYISASNITYSQSEKWELLLNRKLVTSATEETLESRVGEFSQTLCIQVIFKNFIDSQPN